MNHHLKSLLNVFQRSVRPSARLSPADWASGRIVIADGLTPKYQIENAPWQKEPLNTLSDANAKEVVFIAPVGTGKTTFMEAALSYIISEDPGPTLLVGQTDDDLRDWAETRMDYAIRNTPDTANLLPSDRHKKKKMQILFPHMSLFLTGANLSGLQSKSMRRVFNDEAWQYRPGMLNESRGRLHDRWNRQFFILSQAGVKDDELDKAWQQTDKREYTFDCPKCGTGQQWKWCNIVIPDEGKAIERAKASYQKCDNQECDWKVSTSTQERRRISECGYYQKTAQGLPGHIGFHYNVLCNWRKPLWEIVLLMIEAKTAMAHGNINPLRQFIQKRLAESWEEDLTDNRKELVGDGYLLTEFSDGKKIDGEAFRFLTVDKQRDHFWVLCRAWRSDGSSKKLYFGRVETFDQIAELQNRYKIQSKMVMIDAQYDTDVVYCACASRDWTALHGSGRESFPYTQKNGDIVNRPFTRFATASATNGKRARYAFWSSNRIKDILHAHRTGQAADWEIPDDCSSEYLKQIDSETKREIANSKTKQIEYRWVKTRRDNHAWDVEAEQIVAALMVGIISGFEV